MPAIGDAGTPGSDAIHLALKTILASAAFRNAARAQRFLKYLVDETLAGRAEGIKEFVLGVEVFDRTTNFDPRTDTIVRVEATKLRKRLAEYYASEGAGNAVRIEIPKGAYIPRFAGVEPRSPERPEPRPRRRWYWGAGAAAAAISLYWLGVFFRQPPSADSASIAVLPFLNLSDDASNEYFADGLTEELTDVLSRTGAFRVASRTSAFVFKGKVADMKEIGMKLNVASVVEGSVRRDGRSARITAQLIRTADGRHLWSQSFDSQVDDIFEVQQRIAEAIATALGARLGGSRVAANTRTANIEAFDLYLRGRSLAVSNPKEAERLFLAAITADPGYAKPYLSLSSLYAADQIHARRPVREVLAKMRAALDKGIALDGASAEAHVMLSGIAARYEFDWENAERLILRALQLDPYSATAHWQLAQSILLPQGLFEEAEREQRKAQDLDPLSPLIMAGGPWVQFLARRYEEAAAGFRRLSEGGNNPLALNGLAAVEQARGRHREAIALYRTLRSLEDSPQYLAFTVRSLVELGDRAQARHAVAELEALRKSSYVAPSSMALAYSALEEKDLALQELELAYAERESMIVYLRLAPGLDGLRDDARFKKLLEKAGLSDEQIARRRPVTSPVHR